MVDGSIYEVYAVRYAAHLQRTRRESFMGVDPHDSAPNPLDYFVWLARNDERTIIVDTGFDHAEGETRGRKLERLPREGLAALGVDSATVDTVIISHLHYDHAGGMADFEYARFHLQETEMAYATGRCMCYGALNYPYTVDHICEMVRHVYSGRVQFHDGDKEVAPGITVHLIGGHAKGVQAARVMTANGPIVLASDSAHFYENFLEYRPFIITHDVEATLRGYDRLRELADGDTDRIIPGHDPLVMKRFEAPNAALEGIAVRLG